METIFLQIQHNRAHTWEDALKLAKENVSYVTAYEQLLSNPSMTLSAQTKEMKDTMEHTRSLEDLRVLREVYILPSLLLTIVVVFCGLIISNVSLRLQ